MASSPPVDWQCPTCSRSFKRAGHLRRHQLIHTTVRTFQCSQCSRKFARRDALQRHVASHGAGPSLVQQRNRACFSCASAKARCSGAFPCKRCDDRAIDCAFPAQDNVEYAAQDDDGHPAQDHFEHPAQENAALPSAATGNGLFDSSSAAGHALIPESIPRIEPTPIQGAVTAPIIDYSYQDWDSGFFHESNWLEAPMHADMHWSPLSWAFQPDPNGLTTFHDASYPPHNYGSSATPGISSSMSAAANEDSPMESPRSGEYYVDGESARLPRVKRFKPVSAVETLAVSFNGIFSLQLSASIDNVGHDSNVQMCDDNYTRISQLYTRLCCSDALFGPLFATHELPCAITFLNLVGLFNEKFENVLPFLHWTVFAQPERSYLLDLAAAAIGSQFLGDLPFSLSMHEFLRRCLHFIVDDCDPGNDEFSVATALLLNGIGCAYSGNERMRQHALQSRNRLELYFNRLKNKIESPAVESYQEECTDTWSLWIQHESHIRLAFSIWTVDTMFVAHYNQMPMIALASVTFTLPSLDTTWRSKDLEAWAASYKTEPAKSTLHEVLQQLYSTKSFAVGRPEFQRFLTIHGLFHRLWEVERYLSQPLSHWEPSSSRKAIDNPWPTAPVWLPAISTYRAWQNSSCDALDVLHWQANSTIGQMRGIEHPTVLHLHFARIVLLCPGHAIVDLARQMTITSADTFACNRIEKSTEIVRRWALNNQYKARLACIHAGTSFWHIRRHGIDGFYEPASIALAALVLWAFSIFAQRQTSVTHPGLSSQSSGRVSTREPQADDLELGEVILLDRPTDDELVQQFIRDGASMTPFMSGVGGIFSAEAPPRILSKGIELLQGQRCWGASSEWCQLLQALRISRRVESNSN